MTIAPLKPPMGYYGAKVMLARRIVATFPAHQHYVEPFAGSLSVLLAKPRAAHETVNDLDGALVTFWQVLRERPADLARVCALTPHARAEHEASYAPTTDQLEVARRVWIQLSQGRGNRRTRTGWRHFANGSVSVTSMTDYLHAYRERILPAAERIADVSLECRPALDVIARYGAHPSTLLYVDPPYLRSSRQGTAYAVEMPHPAEHRELADALHTARAAVVLSGYHSPLYDEIYADWQRVEIVTQTAQGGSGKARTEVLWTNRLIERDLLKTA